METIITPLYILVFLIAIGESIMLGKWNPSAFRSGIIIFRRNLSGIELSNINLSALQSEFGKSWAPSILFHKYGEKEIFFREKLFSLTIFSYTPIMHGQLKHEFGNSVSLIGRLNWFSIVFAIAWYSFIFIFPWGEINAAENSDSQSIKQMLIVFPIIIYLFLYAIQSYRYGNIAKEIKK